MKGLLKEKNYKLRRQNSEDGEAEWNLVGTLNTKNEQGPIKYLLKIYNCILKLRYTYVNLNWPP